VGAADRRNPAEELYATRLNAKLEPGCGRPGSVNGCAAFATDPMEDEPKFHDLVSLRRALDDRLHRLEQDLKKMTGNIHAQVEQRKALARSLELSRRLLDMYEQVQGSPSWDKIAPAVAGDAPAAETLQNATDDSRTVQPEACEEEILHFDQNRHGYTLRLSRGVGGNGGATKGLRAPTLLSFCNDAGTTLLAIDLIEEPTPYGPIYKSTDVKAFVPGHWIKDFLELSEQVSALKKEFEIRKKYDPAEIDKLKRQFGI